MDEETLRVYRDRRVAAAMAYRKVRNIAPAKVVDAAYAEYDEAHALWRLAQQAAYEAAQSADEARGEPNGH